MHELEKDDDSFLRLWEMAKMEDGDRSADRTRTDMVHKARTGGKREDLRSFSFCCPISNSPPENDNAPKNEKCSMLQNAHFDACVHKYPISQR